MKAPSLLLVSAAAIALLPATGTAQLLLNGSFENPAVSGDGNHIGVTPTSWFTDGSFNLVRSASGGADPAEDGVQYVDLTGSGTYVYQQFTLAASSAVNFGAYFSPRDGTTGSGGNVAIYNGANDTLLYSATRVQNGTPAFSWLLSSSTTPVLNAGTYTFRAIVDDPANVDNAFVTSVPEPTSCALASMALLGIALVRRRRI